MNIEYVKMPEDYGQKVNIPIQVRMRGRYKMEAVAPDGSKRLLADWFPNLITNNGLNLLGQGLAPNNYCCVGSGSTTPAVTDTALTSLVGTTGAILSTTYGNSGGSPYYGTTTIVYQFAAGTATGNLAEVGMGYSNTSLFSHALILNGVGSPTTITVLSSEALNVTYELEYYSPASDSTGNVTIAGTNYAYVIRTANAASATYWAINLNGADSFGLGGGTYAYNGSIGSITGSPSGSSSGASSVNINSYSAGSYSRTSTVTWGLSSGNLSGGITAVSLEFGPSYGSNGTYQVSFSPAIPKTSSYVLTLTFTISWATGT